MLYLLHGAFAFFFFFNDTATTEIYTLSLHDALPIYPARKHLSLDELGREVEADLHALSVGEALDVARSEEHTSELQSPCNLVCRLLLEKKKKNNHRNPVSVATIYLQNLNVHHIILV